LAAKYVGKRIIFGIRPEHLSDQVSDPEHVPVTATIEISEPMGSESIVYFKAGTGNFDRTGSRRTLVPSR
jgi:multiple sugar transport system ATP-binding protein